jgi:hypothetical protein
LKQLHLLFSDFFFLQIVCTIFIEVFFMKKIFLVCLEGRQNEK